MSTVGTCVSYWFAEHVRTALQASALLEDEYVEPAMQAVHMRSRVLEPAAVTPSPAGQVRQAMHEPAPAALNWPVAHSTHAPLLLNEKVPAAHSVQRAEPACATWPEPHFVQVALPMGAAWSTGQMVQTPSPAAAAYPELHEVGVGLPSHECPAGHAAQTRSLVAVSAVTSYSCDAHVVSGAHIRSRISVAETVSHC